MNGRMRNVATADGRELRIIEADQLDGVPVLLHKGTPGSELLQDAWVEDAQSRGMRLISYDRPGYSDSTPHPGRKVANAADDVVTIADALGLDRLAVWGFSGGGPHALACAALLPDLVVAAAVFGSLAPYSAPGLDWYAGMGEDNVTEFNVARQGRDAYAQFIETAALSLLDASPAALLEGLHSLLSPVDAAVLTADNAEFLFNDFCAGIRQRRDGWIDDGIALTTPWGFDLDQIHIPVLLLHGEQDRFVSCAHGKWLAGNIANVDARFLADEGHLSLIFRRFPAAHAWVLSHMG